jgi:hypothetical protein
MGLRFPVTANIDTAITTAKISMVRVVNSPKDSDSLPCIFVAWNNNRSLYLPFLVAIFVMPRTPFILV